LKAGIIGFPQVGKTTLFKILTKAHLDPSKSAGKVEAHIGVATVPDERLDRLSGIVKPKTTTHATVEYIDIAGLVKGESKNAAQLGNLKYVDALVNVVRAFEDPLIPHSGGEINPQRDITSLDLEVLLEDLAVVERRVERLEKDVKKQKSSLLEKELGLLRQCKTWLESEKPLRSLELNEDEKRMLRGFMFLSEKPVLHVLNLSDDDAPKIDQIIPAYKLDEIRSRPNEAITAVCGKIESELVDLPDDEVQMFLADYGLKESGLDRLIRVTYELLGLISFFTVSEDECRAWTIKKGTNALGAAGTVHSEFERCFIRAEVVPWDIFLELKSFHSVRDRGMLKLEGKEYLVQDGDVINVRHSA
jgi:GTP-binding protein YchF